jgi:hypothetical protein
MDEETGHSRVRAERHRRLARQYLYLAEKASSPFLRADHQRAAEEYQLRAKAELRLMGREGASTTTLRKRASERVHSYLRPFVDARNAAPFILLTWWAAAYQADPKASGPQPPLVGAFRCAAA